MDTPRYNRSMNDDFTEEEWREFSTTLLRYVLRSMPLNRLTHAAQSGDAAFRQALHTTLTVLGINPLAAI